MAKVTKQPVMTPEYTYTLVLSEDEAHQLVTLLGSTVAGTLEGLFDALVGHISYDERKYKADYDYGALTVVRK